MPLNKDIKKVLVIGSGPIVIGQAVEFDYAGTQACRALKEEGLEVVLVNSNPATIMTDGAMADEIYIEPLTLDTVKRIIEKEKPDSLLSTLGGQTGLTLSMQLAKEGFLESHNVRLLGANPETIDKAEDRLIFKETMQQIENSYNKLIECGAKPEQARSILPNSLKTEIVVTMNFRSWRNFFRLRTSGRAHPQIREIAVPLLRELAEKMPVFFNDIAEQLPENSEF